MKKEEIIVLEEGVSVDELATDMACCKASPQSAVR